MLFGDEKRFSKPVTPSKKDGQVYAIRVGQNTDEHIGPGSYFFNDVEEERNGWKKKSFSRREPMTPSTKERNNSILNRSDFYQQGVMTAYGAMAMPTSSPKARASPGPGYYDGDILRSPSFKSLHSPGSSYSLSGRGSASTTPRFAFDKSAVLKDGVLFVSRENNQKDIGPGQYAVPLDTLRKSSFNVRASQGKSSNSPLSPNNTSFYSSSNRKNAVNEVLASASREQQQKHSRAARAKSAPRMRA